MLPNEIALIFNWFHPLSQAWGTAMTKEVELRLEQLKKNLADEPDKSGRYAQDLEASIESCEQSLKTGGYKIVGD